MNKNEKGGERIMKEKTREQKLEEFVAREIYACQSSLVEEALRLHLFSVDEIDNLYREFDGRLIDPSVCYGCKKKVAFLDSETGECEECFRENQVPQEIYEWLLVSPWFGKKLLMTGEPVIDNGYGVWWGRTTTGQAISMDSIIEEIYTDILG
jgi:hypothetical protein